MDLFPVRKSDKFGYIDQSGHLIIDFIFDRASTFSEGLARVSQSGVYAFIDESGSVTIELPQIDLCSHFCEGLAAAQKDSKWGYINTLGEFEIEPMYEFAYGFSEGFAKVSPSWPEIVEFIDKHGKTRLSGRNFRISKLREGVINCPHKGRWGFLSLEDVFIIQPQYLHAFPFSEGLAAVASYEAEEYKFINRDNNVIVDGMFQGATLQFSEGLCAVWDPNKERFGYINKVGKLGIPFWFCFAEDFKEEMAVVKIQEKGMYGFINKSGDLVIDTRFTHADSFTNGLSSVAIGESYDEFLYGYIDKHGKYIWEPSR